MRYRVHSRHDTTVDVPARTADGHEIMGRMPAAIVELVPVDGPGATLTHTEITPNDEAKKYAAELFEVGAIIERGGFKKVKSVAEANADAAKS